MCKCQHEYRMTAASYFMHSSKMSFHSDPQKEFFRTLLATIRVIFYRGKKGSYPTTFEMLEVSVRMVLPF